MFFVIENVLIFLDADSLQFIQTSLCVTLLTLRKHKFL